MILIKKPLVVSVIFGFYLFLSHEAVIYHPRRGFAGVRYSRYLHAAITHHPISVAHCNTLVALLTPTLQPIVVASEIGPLYSKFSRTASHPVTSQSRLRTASLGNNSLLHHSAGERLPLDSTPIGCHCHRCHMAYSLVCHPAQ